MEAIFRSVHPRLWRSLLLFTGDTELATMPWPRPSPRRCCGVTPSMMLRRGCGVARFASARVAGGSGRVRPISGRVDGSTPPTGSLVEFLGLLAICPRSSGRVALRYVGDTRRPRSASCWGPAEAPFACI